MPLKNSELFYAYVVDVGQASGPYGLSVAEAFLAAMAETHFTGTIEVIAGETDFMGTPGGYLFAVGVRAAHGEIVHLPARFYGCHAMDAKLAEKQLKLIPGRSEYATRGSLIAWLQSRGTVGFTEGKPSEILENEDSFFIAAVNDALQAE